MADAHDRATNPGGTRKARERGGTRRLDVELSAAAYSGFVDYATEHGTTVAALLEAAGLTLLPSLLDGSAHEHTDALEPEITRAARKIAAARRRRSPRSPGE